MLQNLKVDIVYYRTNTDFELEFNLCGCCRMRLLTDKAPDRKTLVHDLARAVSRSRVIIISGNLFGEDGIMDITARAISKTLTEIDSRRYGISGGEKIRVINGATPLVSPDGSFGGCIIESGPQSMILLTDNRAVRKAVMSSLIHPYIEELCAIEMKEKVQGQPPADISGTSAAAVPPSAAAMQSDVQDTAVTPEPAATAAEATAESAGNQSGLPEAPAQPAGEVSAESAVSEETAEDAENTESAAKKDSENPTGDIFAKAEKSEPVKTETPLGSFVNKPDNTDNSYVIPMQRQKTETQNKTGTASESGDYYIDTDKIKKSHGEALSEEYEDEPPYYADIPEQGGRRSGNIAVLVISVILLIVIAVLCYCIFYVPAREGVSAAAYLRETFSTLFG